MIYYANENSYYIQHYGVLGMKWGRHKSHGSLTKAEKKEYKTSLKTDKKIRRDLELKSYDSAMFANAYYQKLKSYSKKYKRAKAKDPTKSKLKTQRIGNTKKLLNSNVESWTKYNSENVRLLKKHVDQMISKYSNTKIKDVDVKTMKNGVEYVKSITAAMHNSNVTYDLRKHKDSQHNVNTYTPVKTTHYVTYV